MKFAVNIIRLWGINIIKKGKKKTDFCQKVKNSVQSIQTINSVNILENHVKC